MHFGFVDVTTTVSFGGLQTAVWSLARELHDLGHRVTVYGGEGSVRPELGGRDIAVRTFPFTPREQFPDFGTRFRKYAERRSFARRARGEVVAANHDWIVLTKPLDFAWTKLVPTSAPTRFAFLSGGTDFAAGDRKLAERIDVFLAPSHFNAWQIAARFKRFPKVIFNGVDTDLFRPGVGGRATRADLGLAADDLVLAFAGRLIGWKGLAYAVQALAELADVRAKLVLIGDGPQRAELAALAKKLSVADRVIFNGPVPHAELPGRYAFADIGVFPSVADEAFGITIAEAMSCGKPVVASYIGGIPEVVGNEGGCGRLVPPADPGAIAAAVRELAADAALRERIGTAARERIVREFTWRAAAERLLAAIAAAT